MYCFRYPVSLHPNVFQKSDVVLSFVTYRPEESTGQGNARRILKLYEFSENLGISGAAQQMVDNDILITKLQNVNRGVVTVPGDGHCPLHVVSESMRNEDIQEFTTDELCTILIAEVNKA